MPGLLGDDFGINDKPVLQMDAAGGLLGGGGAGPLTAFHGSPQAGLKTLMPGDRGPLGPAVYMSPFEMIAQRYGGNLYSAELGNIFNGLGSRFLPSNVSPYAVWRQQQQQVGGKSREAANLMDRLSPADGYPFFFDLTRLMGGQTAAQQLLQNAGYKGISGWVDGPEVAHFTPLSLK